MLGLRTPVGCLVTENTANEAVKRDGTPQNLLLPSSWIIYQQNVVSSSSCLFITIIVSCLYVCKQPFVLTRTLRYHDTHSGFAFHNDATNTDKHVRLHHHFQKSPKKMHFWISSPWNEVSKSSVFSDFKHWKHCVQKAKTYRKTLLFKKKPCPCELGLTPPRFYWAGPQLPKPTAAVLDDARVSTGCTTAHFGSVPEVRSENMRQVHFFFLKEANHSCVQNTTPTVRFWNYSTIKVKILTIAHKQWKGKK